MLAPPFSALSLLAAASLFLLPAAHAEEPSPVDPAKINGAEVVEVKKEVVGLNLKDATVPTEEDYRKIRQLDHLKTLSFGRGLDDARLKLLAGMPQIESFTTNGAHITDDGIRTMATFPALHNLTFFHPGKDFHGVGLAALADLPNLESFSVGGSTAFADPGLAAVAQLTHLREIRVWHTGATIEGVKALGALKGLRSLVLGQRLSAKPPVTLNDDTVAVLADFPALESLTLQEARLSLPALGKLKGLSKLKRLTLDGIDLSEADLAALRQQLPGVEIKWTAPSEPGLRRIGELFGPR